jgi:hypothetical protein
VYIVFVPYSSSHTLSPALPHPTGTTYPPSGPAPPSGSPIL